MARWYGRAGRLTSKAGGFRPGQCTATEMDDMDEGDIGALCENLCI